MKRVVYILLLLALAGCALHCVAAGEDTRDDDNNDDDDDDDRMMDHDDEHDDDDDDEYEHKRWRKEANTTLAIQFFQAANISTENSTIFAPNNYAFWRLAKKLNLTSPQELLAGNLANTSVDTLKLHVVPDEILRAADIPGNRTKISLQTLQGSNITVWKKDDKVRVKGPGNTYPAKVIKADVPYGTNIVHVINKVLLP